MTCMADARHDRGASLFFSEVFLTIGGMSFLTQQLILERNKTALIPDETSRVLCSYVYDGIMQKNAVFFRRLLVIDTRHSENRFIRKGLPLL